MKIVRRLQNHPGEERRERILQNHFKYMCMSCTDRIQFHCVDNRHVEIKFKKKAERIRNASYNTIYIMWICSPQSQRLRVYRTLLLHNITQCRFVTKFEIMFNLLIRMEIRKLASYMLDELTREKTKMYN